MSLLRMGGNIDLTAGEKKGVSVPDALARLYSEGFSLDQITITSDGNGSAGGDDSIAQVQDLLEDFRWAALEKEIPFEELLKTITLNPARILKLFPQKGTLAPGSDADILILRPHDLQVEMLISQGEVLIREEKPVKKETYETNC